MANQPGRDECSCNASGETGPPDAADTEATKVVKAQVPQEVRASFNLRVVPGRSLGGALERQRACRPRGHTQPWTPGLLGLDEALVKTLAMADKAMVAWLAKDAGNARRFLASPVAAMREAGIELSRTEEKALARATEAAASARTVGPGVDVASVKVQAFPNGRVGAPGGRKPDGKADDFGCAPKRKG